MSESVDVILELYAAPAWTLKTSKHILAGVVGDTIVFKVKVEAVGSFSSDVLIELQGYPTGAVVTYSPTDRKASPGEEVQISVDTDNCSEALPTMHVVSELAT